MRRKKKGPQKFEESPYKAFKLDMHAIGGQLGSIGVVDLEFCGQEVSET
jgi:hypothetical protein